MDRTITAPPNTLCGNYRCQKVVHTEDLNIVRYNGRIFHLMCFPEWFNRRMERKRMRRSQQGAAPVQQIASV